MNQREIGSHYEKEAGAYLSEQGYTILEYNVHSRGGEVDIVARDGEYLVFVEVKYRRDTRKGEPLEAISATKQRRICRCALYYIQKQGLQDLPVRFDVVGVLGNALQLVRNAFEFRL